MVDISINDENYYDAYDLLMNSFRVDEKVRHLLKQKSFLEQNPDIVTTLARLLFLADTIEIDNDEIVARRSVFIKEKVQEPKISIDSVIYQYLIKIKYDTLDQDSFLKLNELQQYPSYLRLYELLNKSIEQQVKVQKISHDEELKMNIDELEVFLRV